MRIITSFNEDGYELYGKTFLESYTDHHDKPIIVYYEGQQPDFSHPLVSYKDLLKVEGLGEFLYGAKIFPAFHGNLWAEKKRNYRYDVYKFCRKSFAQIDAAATNDDWLFWIDADVEFTGHLNFPYGPAFMYYLGRPGWHSCASFVGWNLKHELSGEFWKRYWMLYMTGTVFCLPEWHDSFILDWLRTQIGFESVNLAAGIQMDDGPENVFDKVFPMAHHKKGNLKYVD